MDVRKEFLETAELVVAAVRVYQYREGTPPSYEQLARFAKLSTEVVYHFVRKLAEIGVLRVIESAFEGKVILEDTSKMSELPRIIEETPDFQDHLETLTELKEKLIQDVDKKMDPNFVDENKVTLAQELKERIKDPSKFKKANPLDALKSDSANKENPLDTFLGKKEKKSNPLDDLWGKKK